MASLGGAPVFCCVLFDLDNTLVAPCSAGPARGGSGGVVQTRVRPLRQPQRILHPGLPAVLAELARRNVALGLVTAAPRARAVFALEAAGLRAFFGDCLVTGEMPGPQKPAPTPVRRALALSGRANTQTLYVGDSFDDAAASRAAGVAFGLAAWAGPDPALLANADLVLHQPSDLLAWCEA